MAREEKTHISFEWNAGVHSVDTQKLYKEIEEALKANDSVQRFSLVGKNKSLPGGIVFEPDFPGQRIDLSNLETITSDLNTTANQAHLAAKTIDAKMTLTFTSQQTPSVEADLKKASRVKKPTGTYVSQLDWSDATTYSVNLDAGNEKAKNPRMQCRLAIRLKTSVPDTFVMAEYWVDDHNKTSDLIKKAAYKPLQLAHRRTFEDPFLDKLPKNTIGSSEDGTYLEIIIGEVIYEGKLIGNHDTQGDLSSQCDARAMKVVPTYANRLDWMKLNSSPLRHLKRANIGPGSKAQ